MSRIPIELVCGNVRVPFGVNLNDECAQEMWDTLQIDATSEVVSFLIHELQRHLPATVLELCSNKKLVKKPSRKPKEPYVYPSGFAVGDRVEFIEGERKYSAHIKIPVGTKGTVLEPASPATFPPDAVDIHVDPHWLVAPCGEGCPDGVRSAGGRGAIDVGCLRRLCSCCGTPILHTGSTGPTGTVGCSGGPTGPTGIPSPDPVVVVELEADDSGATAQRSRAGLCTLEHYDSNLRGRNIVAVVDGTLCPVSICAWCDRLRSLCQSRRLA